MRTLPTNLICLLVIPFLATAASAAELPANAEHARQALLDSPRHGEWVDVPLEDASGSAGAQTIRAWIVYPERADDAPVVIVIHEIFGLTEWVRAVSDQLAAEGFIAVAPDLLSGKGPGGGGTESFEGDAVRGAIRALKDDEVTQRLNAVREYARALPAAGETSAAIGFCWGGSTTFMYATRQPKLDAAVVYYGTAPMEGSEPDESAFGKIETPVLGLYGGDDARVTSTVPATAAAMQESGKSFEHHVYDGAGHGFLRQRTGERAEANTKAAQRGWEATIAFLEEHLESAEGER